MKWQEVLEDKSLQDLPYKIELNAWGQIVMSPAKVRHSSTRTGLLIFKLSSRISDKVSVERAMLLHENPFHQ